MASVTDWLKLITPGFSEFEMYYNFVPFSLIIDDLIKKKGFIAGSWPTYLLGKVKKARDLDIFMFVNYTEIEKYSLMISIECGLKHAFIHHPRIYPSDFISMKEESCEICFPETEPGVKRRKLNLIFRPPGPRFLDGVKNVLSEFPMNMTKNVVLHAGSRFLICTVKDDNYNKVKFQRYNEENPFFKKHLNNNNTEILLDKYHPLSLKILSFNILLNHFELL